MKEETTITNRSLSDSKKKTTNLQNNDILQNEVNEFTNDVFHFSQQPISSLSNHSSSNQQRIQHSTSHSEINHHHHHHEEDHNDDDDGQTGPENREEEELISIESAMHRIGFGKYQLYSLCICGLIYATDAMEVMSLSLLQQPIEEEWALKEWQVASLTSVVFLGMLFGSIIFGRLGDRFGRKKIVTFANLFVGVFGLLSSFSPSFLVLLMARGLVGLGVGGAHLAFSLFSESLSKKKRGFWMMFFEIFWSIGSITAATIALFVLSDDGWRWYLMIISIPSILSSAFMYFLLLESPRYYLTSGRSDQASQIIHQISFINRKPLPPHISISPLTDDNDDDDGNGDDDNNESNAQLKNSHHQFIGDEDDEENSPTSIQMIDVSSSSQKSIHRDTSGSVNDVTDDDDDDDDAIHDLTEIKKRRDREKGEKGKFRDLFATKKIAILTLILWFLWSSCAFVYYGVALLTPSYFEELTTKVGLTEGGGEQTNNNGGDNNNDDDYDRKAVYFGVLITSIAELPGIVISSVLVDYIGRIWVFSLSMVLCGVALLVLIFINYQMVIIGTIVACIARGGIAAAFSLVYLYCLEVYPTSIRSTAMGLASSISRVAGIITPFVSALFYLYAFLPYVIYSFFALISALLAKFLPYETNNKPLANRINDLR